MSGSESGPYARIFVSSAVARQQPLEWRVEEQPDGVWVYFSGDVDENVDFAPLLPRLRDRVAFDLADVTRVNSCGVREWVNLQRELEALPIRVEYHHCSPAIVEQLNTISNFRGAARVVSFFAPFLCETCSADARLLVTVAPTPAATALPRFACAHCGAPLVFDDMPERYLSFLREL